MISSMLKLVMSISDESQSKVELLATELLDRSEVVPVDLEERV